MTLKALIEKLIRRPTDPAVCLLAELAGLLLRMGIALLDQIAAHHGEEPPGREVSQPAALRRFRRGDRLCDGTEFVCTDPTDAVAGSADLIVCIYRTELGTLVHNLKQARQQRVLREDLYRALRAAPAENLATLAAAAAQRPRRRAPSAGREAAERKAVRLLKLLFQGAQAALRANWRVARTRLAGKSGPG
jgi:hypothetical protein